jgi:hypothetical protein
MFDFIFGSSISFVLLYAKPDWKRPIKFSKENLIAFFSSQEKRKNRLADHVMILQ